MQTYLTWIQVLADKLMPREALKWFSRSPKYTRRLRSWKISYFASDTRAVLIRIGAAELFETVE